MILNHKLFLFFALFLFLIFPQQILASTEFTSIDITTIGNSNILGLYNNFSLGNLTFNGIPFNIPNSPKNTLITSSLQSPNYPTSVSIPTQIENPESIYFLMNSANTYMVDKGRTLGRITFKFDDNSSYTQEIVVGTNIREWFQKLANLVTTTSDTNVSQAWTGQTAWFEGPAVLDMYKVNLPTAYHSKTLTEIDLVDLSAINNFVFNVAIHLYGITVSKNNPNNPILIIPGFGGSFNFEDLILDNHQPISKWTRAPFAPDYDGLIQTIKNAGYIDTIGYPNRNLFVFYYDWRKPIDQISEDLKRFIDTDISPLYPGKSIKILGHSQGGLVARTYIQKYGDATVKQLITAGTPHNGALDAYYVWEGGQIPPAEPLWIRMAYAIYAKTHEKNYPTRKDFIQNNIYSVKDFLPTFSYLLKQDGTPIPETAMTHRNLWLGTLNSTYTPLNTYYSLFTALGGLGENTKKTITVKPQDKLSQLNGVYPDGIPVAFDNTKEGDGSVLLSSSTFPDDTPDVITQTHGGLVNTTAGIGEIMQLLGISQTPTTLPVLSGNVMAFIKHSPISMEITDPNTVVYQDDAIVVVNAATDGRYTINATGTGDGEYSIYAGLFTETGEFWQEFTNTTHTGQKDTYKIQLNTSQSDPLQIEDSTGTIYLQSALTKLVAVQGKYPDPVFLSSAIQSIKDALLAINGNSPKKSLPQVNQAVNSIFSYRSHFQPFDQKVSSQTFSALQDLVQAYTIVSRNTGRPPAGVQTGYAVNVGKYQEELANLSVSDPALNQKTTSLTQANFFLNQAQQKLNSDNFSAAANLLPVFELLHEAL